LVKAGDLISKFLGVVPSTDGSAPTQAEREKIARMPVSAGIGAGFDCDGGDCSMRPCGNCATISSRTLGDAVLIGRLLLPSGRYQ